MMKKGIVRNSRRLLVKHVLGKNAQKWPIGEDGVVRIIRVQILLGLVEEKALDAPHGPGNDSVNHRPRCCVRRVLLAEMAEKQPC